ncbi:alpha-glucuronidase family glycosyl hydrolase [Povalibacter sp.]|uniref:alpha-glucuronidase family glycosyl hydrolase n=1 Tax=Povalibacter sp. TaxID=1962978 RepID=UPI002F3F9370
MLTIRCRCGFRFAQLLLALSLLASIPTALAEDGYELWQRYRPLGGGAIEQYRRSVQRIIVKGDSPTLRAVAQELNAAIARLLPGDSSREASDSAAALIAGTAQSDSSIAALRLDLGSLPAGGFVIRTLRLEGRNAIVIAGRDEVGVLYGAFHFLRLLQTLQPIDALDIREAPRIKLRMLDHWDNLDRSVERGYAGQSLWDWHKLPDYIDPRYVDYARANASIGINGTVLTNVNANATSLTPQYLEKSAALARVFRPYGIRVFLSARFSAPIEIGGLKTADPLDPGVRAWWQAKVAEIYRYIPDFGGFLVKANSEGQPGPQDYGRSHADGANMLGEALAPHGGVVIWRAFVYSNEQPDDRAKQAYTEFVPLDGKFRDNVLVQVKNGAIDFQPREPLHPLFGAMPRTPLMMEFQITKEYLGFATHLVYLGPLYEEVLRADTYRPRQGTTVASVIDGSAHSYRLTGIGGVANTGSDRNWSGSHFDQANWYVFGRLAWNPSLSSRSIAEEWVRLTFGNEPQIVQPVVAMMMSSHQAAVDYMTPLGLHHLMDRGHHYGPGPWIEGGPRADWTSVYFHRADARGIGFDRTSAGSNAVSQYAPPLAHIFGDVRRVPEDFLLWFHHVPWDYRTQSGRILWDELVHRYSRGAEHVTEMRKTWQTLQPYVDAERYAQIDAFLAIQAKEARWWRDACIAYFRTFSNRPLPAGYAEPGHSLAYYESLKFPFAPGHE